MQFFGIQILVASIKICLYGRLPFEKMVQQMALCLGKCWESEISNY